MKNKNLKKADRKKLMETAGGKKGDLFFGPAAKKAKEKTEDIFFGPVICGVDEPAVSVDEVLV